MFRDLNMRLMRRLLADFQPLAVSGLPGCRAREAMGPGFVLPGGRSTSSWSAGCEGLRAGDGGGDLGGPGPNGGDAQPQPAPAAGDAPGRGDQAQPQPLGFPGAAAAAWVPRRGRAVEGEHLRPGGQFGGHCDELAPDLVLSEAVQGQVAQPGVVSGAILPPAAPVVQQFQVSELATVGVRCEASEPVPAQVGEPQLSPGLGRFLWTITRMPSGQDDRSSRPVSSATHTPGRTLAVGVIGHLPDPAPAGSR